MKFKSTLLIFFIFVNIASCSKAYGDAVELKKEEYVIVKTEDPQTSKEIYGVFKIIDIGIQSNRPFITYRYLFMSDGSAVIDMRSNNKKIGEETVLEGDLTGGIRFDFFYVDWSYKNMNSIWLKPQNIEDNKYEGIHVMDNNFCLTGFMDLEKVLGVDLSSFDCNYN